ncbi:MAG: hypothetical protein U5R14_11260 [Gemmatimonadota bacterium]|nr:hypothetical protein [Gemmatimonadota bacterium]
MSGDASAGSDPGVPEAIPRALIRIRDEIGAPFIERLWIFPPVRRGRQEQGLVAVSTFLDGASDRRGMVTVAYVAEHTGHGVSVTPSVSHEGEAPADRFAAVIEGVVRRSGDELGEPREVEVGGEPARFEELLEEFDTEFLKARDA